MRSLFPALLVLIAALLPVQARAWGYYAHQTTAEIALANVKPETRAEIARLVRAAPQLGTPDCQLKNLEDASVWPDCLRAESWRWGYTFAWHYRTAPVCEAYDPKSNCAGGNCILAQIERNQRVLADESLPANVRLEALAFLVHFIGDLHMPLHSGDHQDRGGNDRTVAYGIVPNQNLHWTWDGALAERAISSAEPSLVRRYSAEEHAALAGGAAADWGRESWQISRDFVYRNGMGVDPCAGEVPAEGALSQEAIVEALPIVRKRVQQAGLRMADMLDAAFAPGPLPQD